jgi:hypothetical protein
MGDAVHQRARGLQAIPHPFGLAEVRENRRRWRAEQFAVPFEFLLRNLNAEGISVGDLTLLVTSLYGQRIGALM